MINNIRGDGKARWIFVLEKYWKIEKWYGCEVGGGNEEKMQRERGEWLSKYVEKIKLDC